MYKVFTPTDPPSVKPDPSFDANAAEDASSSSGPGGTRRAGNLWTAEARDDMFRRRENGESWEDICKDYPRRSRHAMQQQYSMMKKQKAIANGTWTTNRRGRKRRNPDPQNWAPRARPKGLEGGEGEEDATEEDDLNEMGSEDVEEAEESEPYAGYHEEPGSVNVHNDRFALSRSVTEPAITKPQPRIVSLNQHQQQSHAPMPRGTGSNGATPPSAQTNGGYVHPPPYNGNIAPRKRRRVSQDMGQSASPMPTAAAPIPNSSFVPSSVMLDSADLIALLKRGEERAHVMNSTLRNEREAERATFEASLARANRRTSEAHDRLSLAAYEHGDNMKLARQEFSETLKLKAKEHAEAMEKLRQQMRSEQEAQAANVESLSRQNEHLKEENDKFREGRPEREKELEAQMADMERLIKQLEEDLKLARAQAREREEQEALAKSAEEKSALSAASELSARLKPFVGPLRDSSAFMFADVSKLSQKISELANGLDDMGPKRLSTSVQDILSVQYIMAGKIKDVKNAINNVVSTITEGHGSARSGDGDTVMREAPRTPPADHPMIPSAAIQPRVEERKETNGVNNYPHLPSARPPAPPLLPSHSSMPQPVAVTPAPSATTVSEAGR